MIRNRDSWINQSNNEEVYKIEELQEEECIQQQIKEIEEFEHHNLLYRFWNTMFVCQCPTSWWTQFKTLLSRNMHIIIRDPSLTIARFFETIVLSVLVGLVFLQLGLDQSGITNRLSVVFLVMMNECFSLLFAEIQLFPAELPIIYNEVASGLYRVDAYYLAKTVAGIPVSLIFPLIGACINYYMIGFDASAARFVAYIGILWLVTNSSKLFSSYLRNSRRFGSFHLCSYR